MGCGPSNTASVVPKSRLNGTVNSVKPTTFCCTCINPTQPTVNNVKLKTYSIKQNVDHAEPTADSVEPAFDLAELTSAHAEPTVAHEKSTPDSVESTIDPVDPTANQVEPNIDSAESSLNPDEQTIDPVPNIDLTVDSYEQTINSIEPTVDPLEPTADPVEQNVDPFKPTADPVEQDIDPIKHIIDPVEPNIDPGKPTVDPIEPTVDHTEPTVEPVEPNIDPSESTVDRVEPSEDHTEPTVDPVEPSINLAEATVDPVKPTVDDTEPTVDPMEPSIDPAEATVDPFEPTVDDTEPTVDPVEPSIDPAEATVDPFEPTIDDTEPTVDPVEPSIDPAEATVDHVEPTVDHTEPTIVPVESADYTVEPAVDSAEQTDEQAEPTVDPGEPTVDPSEQTVDPDKPTISPDNQNADPVKQVVKSMNYAKVDEHARKAPSSLRNSPQKLVAYLSKPSSEPQMIVRAIYVWISENIAYDTDGFFGRAERAPCDAEAVMRGGQSVCAGYAIVMEMLCREAGIPVKQLSGYSKGYGDSADKPFSTSQDTDHAWNAVQLGGKWFLIDSTWGAGHMGTNAVFKKVFNDFYFLTDPRQFVNAHFPYIDGDMEASMKWQLLEKPVTLEEFNKVARIKPDAFKLGVRPVSHKEGLIIVKNEVTLSFKSDGKDEVLYTTQLIHKQGNMLYEKPDNIFDQSENGLFTTRIHPHTTGLFELTIFGKKSSEGGEGTFPGLFEYVLKCEKATSDDFSFPYAYTRAQTDRYILVEPLQGKLKQNSAINFHITSPYLNRIMINQTFLEKSGSSFKGTVKTGSKGGLAVYGSRNDSGSLNGLYRYKIT